jgi:hypothetical protein
VTAPADPAAYTEVSFDSPSEPTVVTSHVSKAPPQIYRLSELDPATAYMPPDLGKPVATVIPQPRIRARGTRRLSIGRRPGGRRASSSRGGDSGDPALAGDDPPRSRPSPSLEGGRR